MILKKKYTTLSEVLHYLRLQVRESIPYADNFLPDYAVTPKEIFNFLKKETTYKNDPPNIELLQSMETLFSWTQNKHGYYGAGDCDCFTIAGLASLLARGYVNLNIVLAGRNASNPSHIYLRVNGQNFDLTCKNFGEKRYYKHVKIIPFQR